MKKILIIALTALLVIGTAIWFLAKRTPEVTYKTARVEKGTVVAAVSATGTVNAVTTVKVGSQVSGTIHKMWVDYNSRVTRGQVIAEIDPELFLAQVEQARGNAMNAQASLLKAKVTLADTKRTLERNKVLITQGVISQSDFDASQTAFDVALAGIKIAEAEVIQTRGALQQAETNLKNSVIRSPVDGVVISRDVDVGQTVAASFQTPTLFTIAQDLTKMQIETSVDEADISRARLGQTVAFTVDAYPEQRFSGTVSQIRNAPITVQNVVTYIVVIKVDNQDLHLKPGMTANVSIETGRRDGVLKVPAAALRFKPRNDKEVKKGANASADKGKGLDAGKKSGNGGPKQQVYLLKEGKPQPVAVQTGLADARFVEITAGALQEGDEVIIEQVDDTKKKSSGGMPMGPRM